MSNLYKHTNTRDKLVQNPDYTARQTTADECSLTPHWLLLWNVQELHITLVITVTVLFNDGKQGVNCVVRLTDRTSQSTDLTKYLVHSHTDMQITRKLCTNVN